jgi:hypothetical protein
MWFVSRVLVAQFRAATGRFCIANPEAKPQQGRNAMIRSSMTAAAAAVLSPSLYANAQFTTPKVADAKPGDVRVIVTAAIREPLNVVLRQAEAAIDKPIVAEYGSARGNLKDTILKGQDFEVVIQLPDVVDEIQGS